MDRRTSIAKFLDWPTFILYLVLVFLGWMNIHSASFNPADPSIFSFGEEYGKQFLWIATSLVLAAVVILIEGSFYNKFAGVFYLICLLLLILVLFLGKEVHGQKAWFGYGSFGIQPAEFAKPAVCLVMAHYLSSLTPRKKNTLKAHIVPLLLIALPVGAIMLQPDTGTALIFLSFFFVLYREGWSGNILLGGGLLAFLGILTLLFRESTVTLPFIDFELRGVYVLITSVLLAGVLVQGLVKRFTRSRKRKRGVLILLLFLFGTSGFILTIDQSFERLLDDHQQTRVKVLLGLLEDPQGAGYNVEQAQTAIGSGGFWGKGYQEGPLTKYKYVPMQSTDFIFCTIGEEWGFVGTSFIVLLFVVFLLRILTIAERQRSAFARIYAYGVVGILFFHVAINIGMAIGLAPVIGIPLPFFSYGGSSLWAFTILLFILLRLDGERLMVLR